MKFAAVNYAADKSRIRSELMKLAHVGERGEDGRAVFDSPLSRLIGPCSSPSFCEAKSIRYLAWPTPSNPPPTTGAADFRAVAAGSGPSTDIWVAFHSGRYSAASEKRTGDEIAS